MSHSFFPGPKNKPINRINPGGGTASSPQSVLSQLGLLPSQRAPLLVSPTYLQKPADTPKRQKTAMIPPSLPPERTLAASRLPQMPINVVKNPAKMKLSAGRSSNEEFYATRILPQRKRSLADENVTQDTSGQTKGYQQVTVSTHPMNRPLLPRTQAQSGSKKAGRKEVIDLCEDETDNLASVGPDYVKVPGDSEEIFVYPFEKQAKVRDDLMCKFMSRSSLPRCLLR
jgi:hypothetical protein